MPEGVDLSNNNATAPPDFPTLAFCFAKVSEGVSFTDRTFAQWAALSAKHGVLFGGYHFAHPDANPAGAEAAYFLARKGDAALCALDVESRQGHDPLSIMGPAALAAWINEWCSRVSAVHGRPPFLYCNRSYLTALAPYVAAWPIWLAVLDGHAHVGQYAGRQVAIEQYAIVGGVDRDLSYLPLTPQPPQPEDDMTDAQFNQMIQALNNTAAATAQMNEKLQLLLNQNTASVIPDLDAIKKKLGA